MALGNNSTEQKPRKWLSIRQGKVELSEGGQKRLFGYVEGRLLNIYQKQRHYNGEYVNKWFIDLMDEEEDLYSISFPYGSGFMRRPHSLNDNQDRTIPEEQLH